MNTLQHEKQVYKVLQEGIGIPKVIYFSDPKELHPYGNILVMELLGRDLWTLFQNNKCSFTLKTVLMLAEQMIERLKFFHSKGYIHDDIKPDNFMMGIGIDKNKLFIGDYGLSKKIIDNHGKHIPYRQV